MAMYPLQEVYDRWARDELSILQAIGQIIQHLLRLDKEIRDLKRRPTQPATPKDS
jgi:hypothetical protein